MTSLEQHYHRLAIARVRKGFMSQKSFAKVSGLSVGQIANYERGKMKGRPKLATITKVANALGITLTEASNLFKHAES